MAFKVINLDANGKVIPDLSKVVLPDDMNEFVVRLLLKAEQRKATEQAEKTS